MVKNKNSLVTVQGRFTTMCALLTVMWLPVAVVLPVQAQDHAVVRIDTVTQIQLGEQIELPVFLDSVGPGVEMGGFELVIAYDHAGLMLLDVDQGQLLSDCDWEYFSYSVDTVGVCGPFVCSLIVRIVALADTGTGVVQPSCYLDTPGELARLRFLTTRNPQALCARYPVRFFWTDCGDNAFSNRTGDSLLVSRDVIDWCLGDFLCHIEDPYYALGFPTYTGIQSECLEAAQPPIQFMDFYNGYIVLSCQDTSTGWGATVKVEDMAGAWLGYPYDVDVYLYAISQDMELGGFELLIEYDPSMLIFQGAQQGQLLADCEWEYFIYQYGPTADCGGAPCPDGVVQIVALADINNGAHYPICFADTAGQLAVLTFQTPSDTSLLCQTSLIRSIWYDCGDNAFSSKTGDSLLISREVFDHLGFPVTQDSAFPTPFGAPEVCLDSGQAGSAVRAFDFFPGRFYIDCTGPFPRGDINLNGFPNELADWVMFTNYFLYGLQVFTINEETQVRNTDINADGIVLTLADLVYLQRIILGDALPYPKSQTASFDTAVFVQDATSKTVSVSYPDSLAAYYLVFRGNIVPTSLIAELSVPYHFDGVHTRVLAYANDFLDAPPVFTPGPLLTYTGNGILEEAQTSDIGIVIPTVTEINGYPGSHAEISPDTISSYWAFIPDTTTAIMYIGDFADQVVADIDQSTIRINDTMVAISTQVLPGWPGFTGAVMEVTFHAGEFVQGYLPLYDTSAHNYLISGEFNDSAPFTVFGEVTMSGLLLGDVDLDGELNVDDLTYLVDYLFRQGAAPPVTATADLNFDGDVNIADVTSLVQFLF